MATPTPRPRVIDPHSSGWLDHIRTAIFALQLASELTRDEAEIAHIHEVIKQLQEAWPPTPAVGTQRSSSRRNRLMSTASRRSRRPRRGLDPAPAPPILRGWATP
jgi:hypothetical protein